MRSVGARYAGWCGIVVVAGGTGGGTGTVCCLRNDRAGTGAVVIGTFVVFTLRRNKQKTRLETRVCRKRGRYGTDSHGEVAGI